MKNGKEIIQASNFDEIYRLVKETNSLMGLSLFMPDIDYKQFKDKKAIDIIVIEYLYNNLKNNLPEYLNKIYIFENDKALLGCFMNKTTNVNTLVYFNPTIYGVIPYLEFEDVK